MGRSEKYGFLSEIQVWSPRGQSEFIAPLNTRRFDEFRLLLCPDESGEKDAVSYA